MLRPMPEKSKWQKRINRYWWHGGWYVLGAVFLIITLPGWLPVMLAGWWIKERYDQ